MGKRGLTKRAMLDQIATVFGELGVDEVSLDGRVLRTKPPKTLPLLRGYGDELRPGDRFRDTGTYGDGTVFELHKVVLGQDGAIRVLAWVVGGSRDNVGPTSMAAEGPGWRRDFRKEPKP